MSLALYPLLALLACGLLHAAALVLFPRWKLLDFPERYGLIRERLPYPTGILAVITFVPFFFWLYPSTEQNLGLLAGTLLLAASCFLDDRRPLSPLVRLTVQGIAALLIFLTGDCTGSQVCSITNPLPSILGGEQLDLTLLQWTLPGIGAVPVYAGLFTLLWLGLTTNALNWFDGIPGQVNTLSTLGFLTIGFLALSARVGQPEVALLSFMLAGIAIGCLLFDFPPPKVVMGDSGAMFFGLMLGVLTIYAGGKVATAFLVLGVPLIDAIIVFSRRILSGRSPAKGSKAGEHLHHRLLVRGWSAQSIILLNAALGICFGLSALFMDTLQKFLSAIVLFGIILGLSAWARPRLPVSQAD
jgi:UDP-GlcNAc:undecaprenyl-phosphate/decaprenyl-phosphate GlcNAc-1-phosphate transferase